MIAQGATLIILCLFALSASADSIGIIDRTENHFADMVRVVDGNVKVYGVLIETNTDVMMAIGMLIELGVPVIAMPIQMRNSSPGVARMIATANRYGVHVIAAGSNSRCMVERIKREMGCLLHRYYGVEYVNSSFWRSASENTVRRAVLRRSECVPH